MKKIRALTLAVLLLISCVACGSKNAEEPTTAPTTAAPTEPTDPNEATPTEPADPSEDTSDVAANFIMLSIYEEDDTTVSITVYDNEDGTAYVEYTGKDVKKIGYEMDLSVLADIAAAVESSALKALNEQSVYEEGIASASM